MAKAKKAKAKNNLTLRIPVRFKKWIATAINYLKSKGESYNRSSFITSATSDLGEKVVSYHNDIEDGKRATPPNLILPGSLKEIEKDLGGPKIMISISIPDERKKIIEKASTLNGKTTTAFIILSTYKRVYDVLKERTQKLAREK